MRTGRLRPGRAGNRSGETRTRVSHGCIARWNAKYQEAVENLEMALGLEELEDTSAQVDVLDHLGAVHADLDPGRCRILLAIYCEQGVLSMSTGARYG